MSTNFPTVMLQLFLDDGSVAANCLLDTFASGTTTPQTTHTDAAGLVPNTNPIVLDSAGRCIVFGNPALLYTFRLRSPGGTTLWTRDSIAAIPVTSTDEFVPIAGEVTMTGLLTLSGNATANLNPTPLQQVTALIAAAVATVTELIDDQLAATVSAGTSTAYTLTPSAALSALATGAIRDVIFHTASGAAPTIAVSGLAAIPLKQFENGTKVDAKIVAGQCTAIVYDGADWVVASPQYSLIGTISSTGSFTAPGGLIIKMGTTGTIGVDSSLTVTFPVPFPNNCFMVFANPSTDVGVGSAANYSSNACAFTTINFKINNDSALSAFSWIAIGN
jgi:hypothetical protein